MTPERSAERKRDEMNMMRTIRPDDVGRFEWAWQRVHTWLHRDTDDCPTCRSVTYEVWIQRGARALRDRLREDMRSEDDD